MDSKVFAIFKPHTGFCRASVLFIRRTVSRYRHTQRGTKTFKPAYICRHCNGLPLQALHRRPAAGTAPTFCKAGQPQRHHSQSTFRHHRPGNVYLRHQATCTMDPRHKQKILHRLHCRSHFPHSFGHCTNCAKAPRVS